MALTDTEAMKRKQQKINGRPHFVPLAPQAVAILRELHPLTGTAATSSPACALVNVR